jgi:hypothetical protein
VANDSASPIAARTRRRRAPRAPRPARSAFAQFFRDIEPLLQQTPPDIEALGGVGADYGLAMDMDSMGPPIEAHGLNAPPD